MRTANRWPPASGGWGICSRRCPSAGHRGDIALAMTISRKVRPETASNPIPRTAPVSPKSGFDEEAAIVQIRWP
jgi:hypothetical protein